MDVESLAKQLILQNMTPEQQTAVLDSIRASVLQAKEVQKQRVGENVQVVVQALKKLEADIRSRYDETGKAIEKRVASIKDGKDGRNGVNGKDGKDGRAGQDGATGPRGADGLNGRDGRDGENGVSVTDANIDFDGSLIITLSSGRTINVGEVVAPDLAEQIKVITNGGGTSQVVIDTLASLQTQIDNLIPSQTGNAGKFLTTNGTAVSWAPIAAGGLSYQGTWNASTNTPTLTSSAGTTGYYYIVATAGSTNLDGITDWQIGDWLLYNGTVWQKIDQSNLVTSVNGQTGAVSLSTTDIGEGTNLYYTDTRARAAVSAGTGISYSSATGVITNAAPDQTVALTAGTGISTTGTYPNFTVTNTAPDQTVALTQGGTTTITGTYPNFTISSADQYAGTVTSVGGTGTVNGISLSGTVTSSGNLTLGGTLDLSSPPAIGGSTPAAGSFSSLTDSGNLTFTGTGNRITGDFSNGTLANRVAFQTSTVNGNTVIGLLTNGTGTTSALQVSNVSDITAALAFGNLQASSTEVALQSGIRNAGTYLPMTFYTGGSERVRVDTSGNVGIGTSSPAVKLDVNGIVGGSGSGFNPGTTAWVSAAFKGTGSYGGGISFVDGSNGATIYAGAANLIFGNGATSGGTIERARIDSSGNVGIGTSSPATKLHVAGGSAIARIDRTADASANPELQLSAVARQFNVGVGGATFATAAIQGAYYLYDSTAAAYRMVINSSGNVGIGTSSPSYRLDVQTSDTTNPAGYFYNTSGSSNSPALIARGGANNSGDARIIIAQDSSGNEEFGISGTGELRVNAGFGSAGIGYVCRAWVNFNGTGTVAIRASGNVSSITDNGTGNYTLNFTNAMSDANYAVTGAIAQGATSATIRSVQVRASASEGTATLKSTTQCQVLTASGTSTADCAEIYIAVFR